MPYLCGKFRGYVLQKAYTLYIVVYLKIVNKK